MVDAIEIMTYRNGTLPLYVVFPLIFLRGFPTNLSGIISGLAQQSLIMQPRILWTIHWTCTLFNNYTMSTIPSSVSVGLLKVV